MARRNRRARLDNAWEAGACEYGASLVGLRWDVALQSDMRDALASTRDSIVRDANADIGFRDQ